MLIPVYILTVLAAVAGVLQIPGRHALLLRLARADRLRRRADARADARRTTGSRPSCATAAGLIGIARGVAHLAHGRTDAVRGAARRSPLSASASSSGTSSTTSSSTGRPSGSASTLRRIDRAAASSCVPPDALGSLAVAARPRASPPSRPASCASTRSLFALGVGGPRPLLHGAGRLMFDVYTVNATTLIVFPLIVAALVAILPLLARRPRRWSRCAAQVLPFYWLRARHHPRFRPTASFAFETDKAWLTDLGVRYHVGIDGLSLVMVCHDRARADLRARLRGLGGPLPRPRATSRCCCCSSRR